MSDLRTLLNYVREPGWYAIVVCGEPRRPRPLPARGPFRTDDEIHRAIHNYIVWYPTLGAVQSLFDMRAKVFGPYPTRALARRARPGDDVPQQYLVVGPQNVLCPCGTSGISGPAAANDQPNT